VSFVTVVEAVVCVTNTAHGVSKNQFPKRSLITKKVLKLFASNLIIF